MSCLLNGANYPIYFGVIINALCALDKNGFVDCKLSTPNEKSSYVQIRPKNALGFALGLGEVDHLSLAFLRVVGNANILWR